MSHICDNVIPMHLNLGREPYHDGKQSQAWMGEQCVRVGTQNYIPGVKKPRSEPIVDSFSCIN
jgi:hypothetical protein